MTSKPRPLLLALILLGLFLAGCAAPVAAPQDDQAQIDAAVQATLTAVAAQAPLPTAAPAPASDSTPVPDPEQPAAAPSIALPPQIPGFRAAPRPISSLGDPAAPVVMYEWSDYT